jgi:hypothetical protein
LFSASATTKEPGANAASDAGPPKRAAPAAPLTSAATVLDAPANVVTSADDAFTERSTLPV